MRDGVRPVGFWADCLLFSFRFAIPHQPMSGRRSGCFHFASRYRTSPSAWRAEFWLIACGQQVMRQNAARTLFPISGRVKGGRVSLSNSHFGICLIGLKARKFVGHWGKKINKLEKNVFFHPPDWFWVKTPLFFKKPRGRRRQLFFFGFMFFLDFFNDWENSQST